jgi:hypothetical protein
MKKKTGTVEYVEEPDDGLKLPGDARVLSREEEAALGLAPPSRTRGVEWERTESGDRVTLKPRRGGARPGAGRKSKGNVRMQILVSPATRERIRRLARKRGVSMSSVVSEAFKS